ncbi:hypothetical protein BGX23_003217, partial [Mortierella sp. AD031]
HVHKDSESAHMPQCFNFGAYDGKCKYHTCTVCIVYGAMSILRRDDQGPML